MVAHAQQRLSAQVRGRVQGVGYRYFTRSEARRLGLRGWVRNESDGSVSVVAEGPDGSLKELLEALHRGPPGAVVREVEVQWGDARGASEAFEVRYV